MEKKIRRALPALGALLAVLTAAVAFGPGVTRVVSSANSAPAYWSGTTSSGVVVTEGDCPVEVKSELLTFSIPDLPEWGYKTQEEFAQYRSSVTARYEFYNPTDMEVDLRLAFPFGLRPEYLSVYENGEEKYFDDSARYAITADGETVERTLRYSYAAMVDSFSVFSDTKREDAFFSPSLPCRTHTWSGWTVSENAWDTMLVIRLDYNPLRTRIFAEDAMYTYYLENGDLVLSYGLGASVTSVTLESLGEAPLIKSASVMTRKSWIDDMTTVIETVPSQKGEESTFGAYLESFRLQEVGEVDWYNCALDMIERSADSYGVLNSSPRSRLQASDLMRWYDYSLKIGAKQTVVNSVTAPLYPSISGGGEYSYSYLLSPALGWADFGSFDLVIETPYTELSCRGFDLQKTETGYSFHREGLPLGELEFQIEESLTPGFPDWFSGLDHFNLRTAAVAGLCVFGGLLLLGGIAGAVIGIVFGVRRKKKKKEQ